METIAVYGSLKKGKYNHPLLDNARLRGAVKVKGTLYNVGSYPALLDEGDNEYIAEVYDVSDDVFEVIDWMERNAGYKRSEVEFAKQKATVYYADESLAMYCKKYKEEIAEY